MEPGWHPIAGATGQTLVATANGIYNVTFTDVNGCSATSAGFAFTGRGQDLLTAGSQLTVFPNPAQGEVVLQAADVEPDMTLAIISVLGETVMQATVRAKNGQLLHTLDVSGLSKGVYLLTLKGRQHVHTTRLVVQ